MKTILLAGGLGSRLAEETVAIPKPMVEVGGRPISNPAVLPVPQDTVEPNAAAEFDAALPTVAAPAPAATGVRQ